MWDMGPTGDCVQRFTGILVGAPDVEKRARRGGDNCSAYGSHALTGKAEWVRTSDY